MVDFYIPLAFGAAFVVAIVYIECLNRRLYRRLTQIHPTIRQIV